MEHKTLLSTEDLSIGYGDGRIIRRGIDVNLSAGALTCLVGRNGAGKSTLLRTICGFLSPVGGKITIKRKRLNDYSQKELSRTLSVVLTEIIGEIQYLSVRQTVEMGRYPYCDCFARLDAEDRRYVERALETVGITALAAQPMSRISDGQRQKVMIAKALAQDTDLIVLDEPLSFLDMAAKVEIMDTLHRLAHENGKSILLSTHDIDLAFAFADAMWVMDTAGAVFQAQAPWVDKTTLTDSVFGEQSKLIKDFLNF